MFVLPARTVSLSCQDHLASYRADKEERRGEERRGKERRGDDNATLKYNKQIQKRTTVFLLSAVL
jgi:hypothetical protein